MNMSTEPIRLPAVATSLLVLVVPVAIAVLLGQDWRVAAAAALAALVPASGVVAVAESRRARTDSPATVARAYEQAVARVDAAPPDDAAALSAPDFSTPPGLAELDPAELAALRALLAERT